MISLMIPGNQDSKLANYVLRIIRLSNVMGSVTQESEILDQANEAM